MDSFQEFQSCQQGEQGLSIIVEMIDQDEVAINIQAASVLVIRLGYPSGTYQDFTSTLFTDGSDGKMVYVTQFNDLSEAGEYEIQGIVTINGSVRYSAKSHFDVNENINGVPVAPPVAEPGMTFEELVAYAAFNPTRVFIAADTLNQVWYYCGNTGVGTGGFIALGAG